MLYLYARRYSSSSPPALPMAAIMLLCSRQQLKDLGEGIQCEQGRAYGLVCLRLTGTEALTYVRALTSQHHSADFILKYCKCMRIDNGF